MTVKTAMFFKKIILKKQSQGVLISLRQIVKGKLRQFLGEI